MERVVKSIIVLYHFLHSKQYISLSQLEHRFKKISIYMYLSVQ